MSATLLFHWVGWHGKTPPSLTGYDSRDPDVIGDQLSAMARLAQVMEFPKWGVVALTYGPTVDPFIHAAVMEMSRQCSDRKVPFVLCFDPWTVKNAADKNAAMVAALNHPDTVAMMSGRSYLPGRPILDFATGIDKNKVLAAVPGIQIWQDGPDFAWWKTPPGTTNNAVTMPCVCLQADTGTGADRNKDVWNPGIPARIIPAMAGSYYWSLATVITKTPQYIQLATWNDVSEGTDVEKFASMLWGKI